MFVIIYSNSVLARTTCTKNKFWLFILCLLYTSTERRLSVKLSCFPAQSYFPESYFQWTDQEKVWWAQWFGEFHFPSLSPTWHRKKNTWLDRHSSRTPFGPNWSHTHMKRIWRGLFSPAIHGFRILHLLPVWGERGLWCFCPVLLRFSVWLFLPRSSPQPWWSTADDLKGRAGSCPMRKQERCQTGLKRFYAIISIRQFLICA